MHADLLIRLHLNGLNVLVSTKCDIQKKNLFIHSLKRSPQNPEDSGGEKLENVPPKKSAQKQKETTKKGWTWPFGLDMIVSVVSLYPHPSPRYTLYSIASLPRPMSKLAYAHHGRATTGMGTPCWCCLGIGVWKSVPMWGICVYIYTHLLCLYIIYNI